MNVLAVILCTVIAIIIFVYYLSVRRYNYWKKKKVPHLKPLPVFGNYKDYILMRKYVGIVCQELCRRIPGKPYFGTYYGTEPALMILDPEIIKLVFTKDFYYFSSREIPKYTHLEVTTQNLLFTYGDTWKVVRQNLTPIFNSAKIRNMFYLIANCGRALEKMLDEEETSEFVEAKSLMIRYTMDCICSCAYGVETNTMYKELDNNPFLKMGQIILTSSKFDGFKLVSRAMWPKIFYALGFKYFSPFMNTFFKNLLMGVFEKRDFKPSSRHDFVDLVLALKKNNSIAGDSSNPKSEGNKKIESLVTDDLLVSQCIVFFAAGFETSASTLACALYEFAKNQDVQRRAQEEVDDYLRRHNNKLDFECVAELEYIEARLSETLRLYPVLSLLTREVVDDYTFPTDLKVEKGMRIHLPVYHIHRDPNNFPEPDSFRPERFYQDARNDLKPYTFFPFGEGPRQCIGLRFSKMQTTVALATVLKKYTAVLAEGTPKNLEFYPSTILTQSKNAINVKLVPREGWEQRVYAR